MARTSNLRAVETGDSNYSFACRDHDSKRSKSIQSLEETMVQRQNKNLEPT